MREKDLGGARGDVAAVVRRYLRFVETATPSPRSQAIRQLVAERDACMTMRML
jgi:hypothetical protein